jgi:hypothetical protein
MAEVDVPKVGKVNKKVLIPIAAVAVGFIGWKYYQARQVGTGDPTDVGYEDPGTLPPVAGAVRPDGDYGSGGTGGNTNQAGGQPTTNAEWTQFAATQLAQSERWSYTDIVAALGNFLAGTPTTTAQQEIIRAARAIAGEPPVGNHVIVTGGNIALTVAPTGVSATATPSAMKVSFGAVPGAATYNVYRSNTTGATNVASGTGASSPIDLVGLTPNTAYTVQVAGVTASGVVGPKSASISVKTPGVKISAPAKPTVSNITSSSATLTTKAIPFATSYLWWVSGRFVQATDGPVWTATKMKSKTKYTASVQADTATGAPSAQSPLATFTTK